MKSVNTEEYSVFCDQLKKTRGNKRQSDIAALLGVPQTYVSAYELGKVRLDFVQLRNWCEACGTTLGQFVEAFEKEWGKQQLRLERLKAMDDEADTHVQPTTEPMPQKPPTSTVGKTKPTGSKTAAKKAPRRS